MRENLLSRATGILREEGVWSLFKKALAYMGRLLKRIQYNCYLRNWMECKRNRKILKMVRKEG
jgi:hypothetical protein